MTQYIDKILTQFGRDGATSNFEQFGSTVNGGAVFTKDVETIQGLAAWVAGLQSAVYVAGGYKTPILEDFNSLFYVLSYFTGYTLQEGIPYWNTGRTYYIGSVVKKVATSELYMSTTDNNAGNTLPSKTDNSNWKYITQRGILQYDSTYPYAVGELVQKTGTAEIYQSLTAGNLGNALPSQTSTAIWKYCQDLANPTSPVSGISKIKFGFAQLSVSSTASATQTVSKNPAGDFGFDTDMSVYAFPILQHAGFSASEGAPSAFSVNYVWNTYITGSGVDATTRFLNGGSATNTYVCHLDLTVTSNIGQGNVDTRALVVFIGIK